jgi:hypothetical protein
MIIKKKEKTFIVLIFLATFILFFIYWAVNNTKTNLPLKAAPLNPTNRADIRSLGVNFISKPGSDLLQVDGKPFFPVGIYYLPGPESDVSWQKVKDAGINTVTGWWTNAQTLSQADKYGIKFIGTMEYAFKGYKDCKFEDNLNENNNALSSFKSFKSLIVWYGLDEPNLFYKKICLPYHDWLSNNDSHPIWIDHLDLFRPNYSKLDIVKEINNQANASITGFDSNFPSLDLSSLNFGQLTRNYVQNLDNGNLGDKVKAVWINLPAHSEKSELTYDTMRYQAYDTIIAGATGIFWWDWPDGCDAKGCGPAYGGGPNSYSTHWLNIKAIAKELNSLYQGLVGEKINVNFIGKTYFYRVTQGSDGKIYVFIISRSINDNIGKFSITPLSSNLKFFDFNNRDIVLYTDKNGTLTGDCKSSICIYQQVTENNERRR